MAVETGTSQGTSAKAHTTLVSLEEGDDAGETQVSQTDDSVKEIEEAALVDGCAARNRLLRS